MKIIGNGDWLGRIQTENSPLTLPAAGNGFGEILKQTIEQTPTVGQPSASAASIVLNSIIPTTNDSLTGRLEGFFDLLDGYCQKLANPRVSLKGLASSIQQLEEGRDALSRMNEALPADDGLKDVLNQTLITAELEIMRFRRGDYLSA
ncbi:MAG: hypothetical protein MUC57_01415 [Desulfobacterales bacterium]|jgi:hypothetical protein|nr:hypothetical protein [Desulfobacterales bacterium]